MKHIVLIFIFSLSFYSFASDVHSVNKMIIEKMHSKVMFKEFNPKKEKKFFRKYLRVLAKQSGDADHNFMGSYVVELISDKKIKEKYLWKELKKAAASKSDAIKLRQDFESEVNIAKEGQG